jgi:DNA polymerase-3 subunit gamma/tau
MAYTVLARKYRSKTFDDVIGQAPIAATLASAIESGRVHHGFLFTGTRGVGKTSMARILAKALNCLKADAATPKPCGECDACAAIAEGQDIDVIEIDAASNTGVDNIRELRSNTAYRPARARYKVYIIDEVHMLSTGAFNALLKTLEEPPEHVKFILATTEIQKVPATIRSRCQCFTFRHIGPDAIAERLRFICRQEGAEADEAVTRRIARLAGGSMRDALSILDQLLSLSPKLSLQTLEEVLPPAQDEQTLALMRQAAEGDVPGALATLDAILGAGRGLETFCGAAIEVVRALMLIRACGPDTSLADYPSDAREAYLTLAERFELSQYVQMIAMLEELRRNVRLSGAGRALTDALVVRFAKMRAWSAIETLIEQLPEGDVVVAEKKKPAESLTPPRERPPQPVLPGGPSGRAFRPPVAAPAGQGWEREAPGEAGELRRASGALPRAAPSDMPGASRPVRTEAAEGKAEAPAAPAADSEAETSCEPAAPRRVPLSAAERATMLENAAVKETLSLFDGVIVNLERELAAAPAEPEE